MAPRGARDRNANPEFDMSGQEVDTAIARPSRLLPRDASYTLEVLSGPAMGTTVPLVGKRVFVVGRDPLADVCIDDVGMSRRHLQIEVLVREGGLLIRDLCSKNGTFVRNCRITLALMEERGLVEVGKDTTLLLTLPTESVTGHAAHQLMGRVDARLREAAELRGEDVPSDQLDGDNTAEHPT